MYSVAKVTIAGMAPLTFSRMHGEPKLVGEDDDAYDARTWPYKLTTQVVNGEDVAVINKMAIKYCIIDGSQHSKRKIVGYGKSTYTARFRSGIVVPEAPLLVHNGQYVPRKSVAHVVIPAHSDGNRNGSGKRVPRRLPIIPYPWQASFDVWVLDNMITQAIFADMLEEAGKHVGLGQNRPGSSGGDNGRFQVAALDWEDNREFMPPSVIKQQHMINQQGVTA